MKTIKIIRIIVYHALFIGILSCSPDESIPNEIPASKISFSQEHFVIANTADSLVIPVKLSQKPVNSGFVEITLKGELSYDNEYSTMPQAEDDKVIMELVKNVQASSFVIYRNSTNLSTEKILNIALSDPSAGFELGGLRTASVKFMMDETMKSEVNFSAKEAQIEENTQDGLTVTLNFSSATKKSENLKIGLAMPAGINYGTHFYTIPEAVLNEISLDIPTATDIIIFKIIPIDDQILIGDYELAFTLDEMSDGLNSGASDTFIATIRENDNPTGTTSTIAALREEFQIHPGEWFIPTDYFVEGVITSGANVMDSKAAYLQDATGGILIRFNTPNSYKLGDKIRLNLINGTGKIINDQKGIDGLSLEHVILHDKNIVVEAEIITVAQLHTGSYEGRRVKLENVSFVNADGVLTFSGVHNISQGSDVTPVGTYQMAAFSSNPLPLGNLSISGIVGDWGRLMPQVYTHDIIQ